jgi:hypothetical protein
VSLEVFIRNTLLQDESFRSQYREVWRAPTSAFGSDSLRVFGRIDVAAPAHDLNPAQGHPCPCRPAGVWLHLDDG